MQTTNKSFDGNNSKNNKKKGKRITTKHGASKKGYVQWNPGKSLGEKRHEEFLKIKMEQILFDNGLIEN
ncbi:MAG: hypothetical protein WA061_02075 [Microgenomates group bacterium]